MSSWFQWRSRSGERRDDADSERGDQPGAGLRAATQTTLVRATRGYCISFCRVWIRPTMPPINALTVAE